MQGFFPTWFKELRFALTSEQLALMLRSTLFLTCLTAILNQARLLDWVDVLALKFLPEKAFEQKQRQDGAAYRTLVLGITPDLFEGAFGGHTPIDRGGFRRLVEDLLGAYPGIKVIAIDYDFSPGASLPCGERAAPSVCAVAEQYDEQQRAFDRWLSEELPVQLKARGASLVLIRPLPHPEDLAPMKQAWQERMRQAGVHFGDHLLLYHNWLSTVVKHRMPSDADACGALTGDGSDASGGESGGESVERPLATVVNEARRRAGLPPEFTAGKGCSVELINFAEGRNDVFMCPLWEWSDIADGCKRRLQSANSAPDAIDTVFIGSAYGEEDKFRSPLGDQYGVELHAFGAYSQRDPLEQPRFASFAFDLGVGMISALLFQTLWGGAGRSGRRSFQRFVFIVLVFGVLIGAAWLVVWMTPAMLKLGLWMNPLMIFVGLFIDSYAGVVEGIGQEEEQAGPMPALTALSGWEAHAGSAFARAFLFVKKVLFYWLTVLAGLYFTFLG
jgi:hypothetical protein